MTTKTIYAVVRIDKVLRQFGCNVYAKQSSNLDTMKAYHKEISDKYPHCEVVLVSRESAEIIAKKYREYWKKSLDKSRRV